MATHLITGYAGKEHIMASDQGSFNASFFGTGQFVMEAGSQCEASIIDNNTVRVFDGDILMKGRHIRIKPNTYEDCIITTGTADMNRYDLICMQYSKDLATGIESCKVIVLRGEESTGTPNDPEYVDGDILAGDSFNQMPLYRVKISGVVLSDIECLFDVIPTYATLAEQYAEKFKKDCETHLDSLGILDTMEEIEANTQPKQLAGALALKECIAEVNTKANKRAHVGSVIGTTAILVNDPVYQINCMVLPYPDSQGKHVIPITIDIGILNYVTNGSNYILTYGGTDTYIDIVVTRNASNISVALRGVKWSGVDVTSTARLIVYTVG